MPTLRPVADGDITGWYGHDGRTTNLWQLLADGSDATYLCTGALVAECNVLLVKDDDGAYPDFGLPNIPGTSPPLTWTCAGSMGRQKLYDHVVSQGMQLRLMQSYAKCEQDRNTTLHGVLQNGLAALGSGSSADGIDTFKTIFAVLRAANYQTLHEGPKVINGYTQGSTPGQASSDVESGANWERYFWRGTDEGCAICYGGEQDKHNAQMVLEHRAGDGTITVAFDTPSGKLLPINSFGPHITDYCADHLITTLNTFRSRSVGDPRKGRPWFAQWWLNNPHGTELPLDNSQVNAAQTWLALSGHTDRDALFTFYKTWMPPWYAESTTNGGDIPIDLTQTDPGDSNRWYDQKGTGAGLPKMRVRMQSNIVSDDRLVDVIANIKAAGEWHKTYLILCQDNSYALGLYDDWEGKEDVHEWVQLTSIIIVGPTVPRGQYVDQMMSNAQLAPLILARCGITDAEAQAVLGYEYDAVDPLPTLLDDPSDMDDWCYYMAGTGQVGFRTKNLKHWTEGATGFYYNVATDPWEETNLYPGLSGGQQTALATKKAAVTAAHGAAMKAMRFTGV